MPKPSNEMNKNNNHTTNLYTKKKKKTKEQAFIPQPIKGKKIAKPTKPPKFNHQFKSPGIQKWANPNRKYPKNKKESDNTIKKILPTSKRIKSERTKRRVE